MQPSRLQVLFALLATSMTGCFPQPRCGLEGGSVRATFSEMIGIPFAGTPFESASAVARHSLGPDDIDIAATDNEANRCNDDAHYTRRIVIDLFGTPTPGRSFPTHPGFCNVASNDSNSACLSYENEVSIGSTPSDGVWYPDAGRGSVVIQAFDGNSLTFHAHASMVPDPPNRAAHGTFLFDVDGTISLSP